MNILMLDLTKKTPLLTTSLNEGSSSASQWNWTQDSTSAITILCSGLYSEQQTPAFVTWRQHFSPLLSSEAHQLCSPQKQKHNEKDSSAKYV